MRKTVISLLAFLAAILMIFSSCITEAPDGEKPSESLSVTESTAAGTVEENPPEEAKVFVSDYAVVRPFRASDTLKQATADLCNELRKNYGGIAGVSDDWLENGDDPDSGELHERREILLGATNRGESRVSGLTLGITEYVIFTSGTKIVILGGSDKAVASACKAFLTLLKEDADGKFTVELPNGRLEGSDDTIKPYLIIATDQKLAQVTVYDVTTSTDISSAKAVKTFGGFAEWAIADTRLREYEGKTVVLAAYGGTCARMIDYETGEDIFSTNMTAQNPHAAEILPCGVLAVASSTGAQIRFFNVKSGKSEMLAIDYPDAHGLLYDPQNDVIFAVGTNLLKAYRVSLADDGTPVVTEATEFAATIPTGSAHDLQPVYGDTDRLWISTGSAVYQYSKSQKKFFTDYEGNGSINKKSVKAIGNFEDGSVLLITPDKVFQSWTSASAMLYIKVGNKFSAVKLSSGDGGFYKVRVANKNYQ